MPPSLSILAQAKALLAPNEQLADDVVRGPSTKPSRIVDVAALNTKIEEIRYTPASGSARVPWIETLAVVGGALEVVGESEDVKREECFLVHATESVKEGFRRLRVMKVGRLSIFAVPPGGGGIRGRAVGK